MIGYSFDSKSRNRCGRCGVLLDKSWMRNAHACVREDKTKKQFIKRLLLTEVILGVSVAIMLLF